MKTRSKLFIFGGIIMYVKEIQLLLASTVLCIAGCANQQPIPFSSSLNTDPNCCFTLFMGVASASSAPMDINVEIDGKLVVHEVFSVDKGFRTFELSLSGGEHRFRVWSAIEGVIETSVDYKVTGENWVNIVYIESGDKSISGRFDFKENGMSRLYADYSNSKKPNQRLQGTSQTLGP